MQLTSATRSIPAAQYIRMSREHQRFSPENQRAAILAYALAHGFEIVATYQDDGKSGLTMTGRPELKRLLRDALDDEKTFRAILVLDVSRWGRFQDADQAAHYEYMCREAGAPVFYCSEAFDNGGGAMATLIKQMKRVMAAEYSRELSTKVSRAQRQQARLGYKQGGPAILGTRRQVVDEHGRPRMILAPGQQKGTSTDRVVFVHGPAREVALVRLVFELYVSADLSLTEVAGELNRRRRKRPDGNRWHHHHVRDLLSKEILTGTYVFGLNRNNLGNVRPAAQEDHVRVAVMNPIVSAEIFQAAREKWQRSLRLHLSNDELLVRLERLCQERGYINTEVVRECPYLPGPEIFTRRFGSLKAASQSLNFQKPYRSGRGGWKRVFSNEELLDELRRIRQTHGYISQKLIEADLDCPRPEYFRRRFGSLELAYELIDTGARPFSNQIYMNEDGSPLSEEWLLARLNELWERHGFLSQRLINKDPSCPSAWFYCKTFGDLLTAYKRIGYCVDVGHLISAARRRGSSAPVSRRPKTR